MRSIDAERHVVDHDGIDAHPGLQRPQLLQPLAHLQRRRREADETLQRFAAIGIETDVMIERAIAPGRRGAGEVERPQPARRHRRADRLDYARLRPLMLQHDLRRQSRDGDLAVP